MQEAPPANRLANINDLRSLAKQLNLKLVLSVVDAADYYEQQAVSGRWQAQSS